MSNESTNLVDETEKKQLDTVLDIEPYEVISGVQTILRERMEPVQDSDFDTEDLHDLVDRMNMTLHAEGGIGLSANQVGAYARLFIRRDHRNYYVYINPEIVEVIGEDTQRNNEGCLSSKGLWVQVTRPNHIRVRARRLDGALFEEELIGLDAAVFLHELDHLNGVRYIDRVPTLRRKQLREKAFKDGVKDVGPLIGESLKLHPKPLKDYDIAGENSNVIQPTGIV